MQPGRAGGPVEAGNAGAAPTLGTRCPLQPLPFLGGGTMIVAHDWLSEREALMRVESILKAKGREVETTSPDTDLRLVVNKLSSLGVGALVVSADGKTVKGTISERDIVRGLNKHGNAALDLQAGDVMSRSAPTCSPNDLLQDVMAKMTQTRHRHVPVLDENGHLCGIVSIGDVVKHRLDEMELEANVLRDAYIARR